MTPAVVVVGGGVTGLGVARDLAMRGADVTLFERGSLAAGTSGRMHGLLHSGARYAVADPESARECAAENRVLRRIADHCVAGTGGLFVARPEDSDAYVERKLDACRDCAIPVEAIDGAAAREAEPALAADVERAIRVPDAAIDPVGLCAALAAGARRRGATVRTTTAVTDIVVEGDRVVGVEAGSRVDADHVVNAAGPWAGRVAALAGADLAVRHSKGAMAVLDYPVGTVLNRCRPKTEGDIVVPWGERAVLGTTDRPVEDPEAYDRDPAEIELLRAELGALVPPLRDADRLDAFWGVRPLYDHAAAETTGATRGFAVVDHAAEGADGLTSVVGGKLTTHRLMAEAAADAVCERLGHRADCRTATEPLPDVPAEGDQPAGWLP